MNKIYFIIERIVMLIIAIIIIYLLIRLIFLLNLLNIGIQGTSNIANKLCEILKGSWLF